MSSRRHLRVIDGGATAPARTRPRTVGAREIAHELDREPYARHPRPRTRGECTTGPFAARPCPFAGCAYHLYADVHASGSLRLNRPDPEVWEFADSCALDIADRGGLTLEEIGRALSITREGLRQIELRSLTALRSVLASEGVAYEDLAPDRRGDPIEPDVSPHQPRGRAKSAGNKGPKE